MNETAYRAVDRCSCGGAGLTPSDVAFRLGGRPFRLLRCGACGRLLLDPLPSEAELAAAYDTEYYGEGKAKFIGPVEAFVEHFRGVRAREAHRLLGGAARASPGTPAGPAAPAGPARTRRVLDIGCGSGQFLARLAALGYECHGTEFSEEAGRRAAAIPGVRLHVGAAGPGTFEPGSLDLISVWHVLEHLPDPDLVLRSCRRWLAPGGHLLIAVPNIGSWQARLFRGAWFHVDPPRHLQHFDPESLARVLGAAGFRLVRVRHLSWEQNLYGYLQSALNALGLPRDQLYGLFKGARPRGLGVSPILQALLAALLLPVAVVATALEAAAKHGGTIECVAVAADAAAGGAPAAGGPAAPGGTPAPAGPAPRS